MQKSLEITHVWQQSYHSQVLNRQVKPGVGPEAWNLIGPHYQSQTVVYLDHG